MTNEEMAVATENTKETYLALAFLMNLDWSRYSNLLVWLKNNFLKGSNEYPCMMTVAYNLLTNWKQDPGSVSNTMGSESQGIAFVNFDDDDEDSNEGTMLATQGRQGG